MEETATVASRHPLATDASTPSDRMYESDGMYKPDEDRLDEQLSNEEQPDEKDFIEDKEDGHREYGEYDEQWGTSSSFPSSSSPSSASSTISGQPAIRIIKFKIPGHEESDTPTYGDGDVNVDIISEVSSEPEGIGATPAAKRLRRRVPPPPLSTARRAQHLTTSSRVSIMKSRSIMAKVISPPVTIKSPIGTKAISMAPSTMKAISIASRATQSTSKTLAPASKSSAPGSKGAPRIQDLPGYISDMRAFVQEMQSIRLRPWLRTKADLHGIGTDPTTAVSMGTASTPSSCIAVPIWIRCDGGTSSARRRQNRRQNTSVTQHVNGTTTAESDSVIQLLASLLKRIPAAADEGYLCEVPRCAKLFHEKEKYRRHLHNHVRTIKHQQARNFAPTSHALSAEHEEDEDEEDSLPLISPPSVDSRIPWTVRLYPFQVEATRHIQ